ncbi:MAG TPA: DUF488 domain-containing protein [Rhizomicrobium sp.]
MALRIKRIYQPAAKTDGMRVLVDRLWPRGISKARAKIDLWQKEAAPSAALRRWFGHKPERWSEFRRRYRAELAHNPAAKELRKLVKGNSATLLYGAHDEEHNQAVVLAAWLRRGM